NLQLTSCVEVTTTFQGVCQASFQPASTTSTKKKKKGKKAKISRAGLHAASPLPQINVPNIQDLLPQLDPSQEQSPESTPPDSGGNSTTTTPEQDQSRQPTTTTQAVSMREASMFLQFLLGGGA